MVMYETTGYDFESLASGVKPWRVLLEESALYCSKITPKKRAFLIEVNDRK